MPLNTEIALQGRGVKLDNPLDVQARAMTLSNLMRQREMQDIEIQRSQKAQQQDSEYGDALRSGVGPDGRLDYGATLGNLARGGNVKGYQALLTQQQAGLKAGSDQVHQAAQTGKLDAETGKIEYETKLAKIQSANQGIASLLSRPNLTHDDVLQFMAQRAQQFPKDREMLAQYARDLPSDPVMLRQKVLERGMQGMKAEEMMKLQLPKTEIRSMGGADQSFSTNQITGDTTPGASFLRTQSPESIASNARMTAEGAAGRAQSNRHFNLNRADANQAVTYRQNVDGEFVALPSRLPAQENGAGLGAAPTARAVMGPDGKPLKGNAQALTEDQGKAMGWLVKSENAFRNMQAIFDVNPSASKPGFPEVIEGIPSMGVGKAVANVFRSEDRQKFNQATASLSESLLRAATGAGFTEIEAQRQIAEVTPVWGEKGGTTAQKLAAIPLLIDSLRARVGATGERSAKAILDAAGLVPMAGRSVPAPASGAPGARPPLSAFQR